MPKARVQAMFLMHYSSGCVCFFTGRRQCLGEQLAKLEIFIFGVSLLQRFEFQKGDEMPSLEGEQGVTLMPYYFEFRAVRV